MDGVDWLSGEATWALAAFPGTIANMLSRRISSRGYHARFAKRLPHVQRGLLDAKARRHLSTEYALITEWGGVPAVCVSPQGAQGRNGALSRERPCPCCLSGLWVWFPCKQLF